jgi:hypothetical protein
MLLPRPLREGGRAIGSYYATSTSGEQFPTPHMLYLSIRIRGSIIANATSDSSVPTMVRNE